MNTKTIYIEANEGIPSILEKISEEPDKKINLIVPRDSILLQSATNFKLFKKESNKLGKSVVIISNDPFIEETVKDTRGKKVLTFNFIKMFKPQYKLFFTSKIFISGISLAVLSVVIISAYFGLPRATIKIVPKTEEFKSSISITVDQYLNSIDFENAIVPGKLVAVEKSIVKRFQTSKSSAKLSKASGIITVYNTRNTVQALIPETRFLSDNGKLFYSLSRTVIPANGKKDIKVVSACPNPSKLVAQNMRKHNISCSDKDQSPESFNIGPSTFSLPACKEYKMKCYKKVYAKSVTAMSGGSSKSSKIVSNQDIENAKEATKQELEKEIVKKLRSVLLAGSDVFDKAGEFDIISEDCSAKPGDEVDAYNVTMTMSLKNLSFQKSDINKLALNKARALLPSNMQLQEQSISFNAKSATIDLDQNKLFASLDINADMAYKIDNKKLKSILAGKNEQEIHNLLASQTQVLNSVIKLWPFWVKRIPYAANKIQIEINE